MAHQLPPLPYAYEALEPHIDKETMTIHHDRHHAAYVNNLNAALEAQASLAEQDVETLLRNIEQVPANIKQAVINNGGGHANHTLFWEILAPGGANAPTGALAAAIEKAFGSFDALKADLIKAGTTRFGSGWSWLVVTPAGELKVYATLNQDSPLMSGDTPILGIDVWEHAYYLKYQNKRPDYLNAFFNVVNWSVVGDKFAAASK
jgi:superoxide dismutase, Fe-Mn family